MGLRSLFEWIDVSIQYPKLKSCSLLSLANTLFMFTNLFYLAVVSFLLLHMNWTSWSWFLSIYNSNSFHLLPPFDDCFRPLLFQLGHWSCTTLWNRSMECSSTDIRPYMLGVTSWHHCIAVAICFVWAPNFKLSLVCMHRRANTTPTFNMKIIGKSNGSSRLLNWHALLFASIIHVLNL